jgi:subtilisin-like proprotein convertase family protein
MKQRPKDKSKLGYVNWPFMSVHTWGELAKGRWKLMVTDVVNSFSYNFRKPNAAHSKKKKPKL